MIRVDIPPVQLPQPEKHTASIGQAFSTMMDKYLVWPPKPSTGVLCSSDIFFLSSVVSDLDRTKQLLPELSKEIDHIMELIENELI